MTDDIVTRLRTMPRWQRDIVEGKTELLKSEQLRINDNRRAKRLLLLWWAVRGE